MTPTNDQKMRVVAEKLGMWKEGQRCVTPVSVWEELFGASTSDAHDIPPPNFLEPAGADALMTALLECNRIGFYTIPDMLNRSRNDIVCKLISTSWGTEWRSDPCPTWREALLDAAFKLLGENADD